MENHGHACRPQSTASAPCPATVCAEAYNPDEDEDADAEPRVVNPKTDEQRRRLQDACQHILLFKTLDQVDHHALHSGGRGGSSDAEILSSSGAVLRDSGRHV